MEKFFGNITYYIILCFIFLRNSLLYRGSCRYYPSCSEYAQHAFLVHHPAKAFLLVLRRVLRCNILSGFGYDPVQKK